MVLRDEADTLLDQMRPLFEKLVTLVVPPGFVVQPVTESLELRWSPAVHEVRSQARLQRRWGHIVGAIDSRQETPCAGGSLLRLSPECRPPSIGLLALNQSLLAVESPNAPTFRCFRRMGLQREGAPRELHGAAQVLRVYWVYWWSSLFSR